MIPVEILNQLVQDNALVYTLDPNLVRAMIQQENSALDHKKVTWEPADKTYSVGLGQIEIPTARMLGLSGSDDEIKNQLMDPDTNIRLMCKYLRDLSVRYKSTNDIIAGYNAGSAIKRKDGSGKYINQGYVDKVLNFYNALNNNGSAVKIMFFAAMIASAFNMISITR